MTLTKREHSEAQAELRHAAFWYDGERLYLGDEFTDAIDETIQFMRDWPLASPVFSGWNEVPEVHSESVRGFPYRVIYYLTEASVVIVAYAHNRQKSGYWQHRLDE